jgi:hypothetical protein
MDEGLKGLNNNINININQPALVANTKTLNGIAYFLVTWFVGFFGVHRFMRGQAGMGVLYILTFGLFGIGWMIDWILSIVYLFEMDQNNEIHFVNGKYAKVQK